MMNKSFIVTVTIIVTLLCIYYLSFSLISSGVQDSATEYATDTKGNIDFYKKQKYIDSVWNLPVYDLGFAQYTYKEVKDHELHLGLDLQGGMHVVLEVSPAEIITAMSNNSPDENFRKALKSARDAKGSQESFTSIFFNEYEKLAGQGQLNKIFANASNQGVIDPTTGDAEIKRIITDEVEGAIDRSYQIIKTRIDKFGVTQPNVQRIPGTGRIQVELPGVDNPERVRKLLQGVAKLEFWEVWNRDEYNQYLISINDILAKREKVTKDTTSKVGEAAKKDDLSALVVQNDTLKSAGGDSVKIAENTSDSSKATTDSGSLAKKDSTPLQPEGVSSFLSKMVMMPGLSDLVYEAADTAMVNTVLNDDAIRGIIPNNLKFMWNVKPIQLDQNDKSGKQYYELYAIKKGKNAKAPLGGEVITNARQGFDDRGRPDISMSMNADGARGWRKLTGANVNRRIAIVLDNFVYSAPVVQDEIAGGQSSITGSFTIEEAKDLSNILKAGKLPAPTRIVEEAVVGPSLGKESIQQGLFSTLTGFLLVVVFMGIYYAASGWVANASLMVNVFFIVGILAQFNASLTLPGIAGIVLTIGMAVDANVLIFERIKEEIRNGKTLLEAIRFGFDRAFWTIFDSNLTTLLTAFFLFSFGTGPIKGFATTLMIGIFCSFFTAVFVSRVIIELIIAKKGNDTKLSFSTPFTKNLFANVKYDYIGKKKIAYVISGTIIIVGLTLAFIQGLNFGVDFKGGRTFIVEFNEKVVASDVRSALVDDFENKGTEVKTYGSTNKVKVTTVYMIDDDSDQADAKVLSALENGLKGFEKLNPKILSSSKVGATVASDIRDSAFWAVFTSLLAIFGYIVLRFRKWQFGLGAVVALFHDVLITIALTAIVRNLGLSYEIDQVFVAAILTIIGYSINDTVVVFDRIREYLNNHSEKANLSDTLNEAIGSTFSRTFMTAFTTFIVVFILFIAGGEVLRGFSFAMIIGLCDCFRYNY
ncbi:MAG: protein translocase subunit SecDF [Thermoflexibacter sp.]|nr:protein translocase subunit SecDF [Thermoflexibacter sp.]